MAKFECGNRVLVRNSEDDKWVFGRYEGFSQGLYFCWGLFTQEPIKCEKMHVNSLFGEASYGFKYCIPYRGNEFLEGKVKTDKVYFAEVKWYEKYYDMDAYWNDEENDFFNQLEALCLSNQRDAEAIVKLATENVSEEWYLNPGLYITRSIHIHDISDDFIPLNDTYILNRNVYTGHGLIMGLNQQELDALNQKRVQNGLPKFECYE